MINELDRETLLTLKIALHRALNSYDYDIGTYRDIIAVRENGSRAFSQALASLELLSSEREKVNDLYTIIRNAIG